MKKALVVSVLALFICVPLQAQFLKSLQQKVSQQVEDVVSTKVANIAAKETNSLIDNLFETSLKNYGGLDGFNQAHPDSIPDVYEFDHFYDTKIESREGDMFLRYLLKKDAPYFGLKMGSPEGMYVVIDPSRKLTVMYMNSEQANFITATNMPAFEEELQEGDTNVSQKFKKIENKTILDYNCQGFQGEDEEAVYTFYITGDAGISFQEIYKNERVNIPKGINPELLEDGLMMQMTVKGKNNNKNNISMTCVAMEQAAFSLFKKDYLPISQD